MNWVIRSCIVLLIVPFLSCANGINELFQDPAPKKEETPPISSFAIMGVSGAIDGTDITVVLPGGTELGALPATFTSTGRQVCAKGVIQESGTTPVDFNDPVIYRVYLDDWSYVDYTVRVVKTVMYWSRMESLDGIVNPETKHPLFSPETIASGKSTAYFSSGQIVYYPIEWFTIEDSPQGLFGGNCYHLYMYTPSVITSNYITFNTFTREIHPIGKDKRINCKRGAVSYFFKTETVANQGTCYRSSAFSHHNIQLLLEYLGKIDNLSYLLSIDVYNTIYHVEFKKYDYFQLLIDGYDKIDDPSPIPTYLPEMNIYKEGIWNHLYIIWDGTMGLKEGKSLRVFLNGNETIYLSSEIKGLDNTKIYFLITNQGDSVIDGNCELSYTKSNIWVDNIKLWDHVFTEDPDRIQILGSTE